MDFVERLRAQFEDGVEPRRLIDEYFDASGAGFTGSQFELIVDRTRPNEFTADDFAAVSTLSVTVPAPAPEVAPQAELEPTLVIRGARKVQEQIENAVERERA